jgi:DNA (cytosine-5)-methyltransferase 1
MNKLKSIELFAGAGGLALGMEKAGFEPLLLNELEYNPSQTLKINRPKWNVIQQDIHNLNFKEYKGKVDLLTGGFPCQAFSHSGKRLGFQDVRGTLFYEFARAIRETEPTCFLAENVKGLLNHDSGKTISIILNVFSELGYHVFNPLLLNANNYEVAQKRERIFIFGVKKEFKDNFQFNEPITSPKLNLKDIFYKGKYYKEDVSNIISLGVNYSKQKQKFFEMIQPGKNWKSLPENLQKEYLGNMFFSEGGKTGILRRLSYDEACVTLLTSPSQKQTERCHPEYCRPLNIREYARIQSFPDEWIFQGSITSQYKQIGNAVPVMLAYHVGKMIHEQMIKISNK